MKRTIICCLLFIPLLITAQSRTRVRKYPSLLWEISGHGMPKTSFLFGTMHVSSKLAFHLADSFYLGIRKADVVALETNPESWQEDMSKYAPDDREGRNGYVPAPSDYFTIKDLRFYKYTRKIERALNSNPSTINNLLYRSYGNESSDFEEDTYLDMYIYQCGKRWGKQVAGVEQYAESMRLMSEAYKDASKEKNRKAPNYDRDEKYSFDKLQEAYRNGNLDWLDSINRYNSMSDAFDEKFLYRRNEIQAASIDSILRSGRSLFVGVGAAHLPGNRGVIEILRRMGYTLRPVKMGARDSEHKNQVEKLRVPVVFNTQVAPDGLYRVDVPGHFYQYNDENNQELQYADMANGSYYMVSRIMTNAWMWGHGTAHVKAVVDSLLYENIPGRIVERREIMRNGYSGIEVVNKTRRGDTQRYNIFITPFEVLIFKMSGTAEYVSSGPEASRFFGSIVLKPYEPLAGSLTAPVGALTPLKPFSPAKGGFEVSFPHRPYEGNDGSMIFDASDAKTNTRFRVMRTDVHNTNFLDEDSFDLALMEESFGASDFIDKVISRTPGQVQGYPSLDVTYSDKSGSVYLTRFIIHGPQYYSVIAHGNTVTAEMREFLQSFHFTDYKYGTFTTERDTLLAFSAMLPQLRSPESAKLKLPGAGYQAGDADEADASVFRGRVINSDSTGERIYVSYFHMSPYDRIDDSTQLDLINQRMWFADSSMQVRSSVSRHLERGGKTWDAVLGAPGSSRVIRARFMFQDGGGYLVISEGDSISAPSAFVKNFFDSFTPADSMAKLDAFASKSDLIFNQFFSKDSTIHKKAVNGVRSMKKMSASDLPNISRAIGFINWTEPDYLSVKKSLIGKLGRIGEKESTDLLRQLYVNAGDTLELQHAVLESMLMQQTDYSFKAFRDIMANEPPILELESGNDYGNDYRYDEDEHSGFMSYLQDSLQLTRKILPDILPVINLRDYEDDMLELLAMLADSGLVKPKIYDSYFSKFQLEARQLARKQAIAEKQEQIASAEKKRRDNSIDDGDDYLDSTPGEVDFDGKDKLMWYASLLLPSYDSRESVRTWVTQLLHSQDDQLKYDMLQALIMHHKPYPDTLIGYFAAKDLYRFKLYQDLYDANLLSLFPVAQAGQLSLVRSMLISNGRRAGAPDSLVYLDRFRVQIRNKEGYIYFFKYKESSRVTNWSLAYAGLLPLDSTKLWFGQTRPESRRSLSSEAYGNRFFLLTDFSETKIRGNQPLDAQLKKELKKLIYGTHLSAAQFYSGRGDEREDNGDEDESGEPGDDGDEPSTLPIIAPPVALPKTIEIRPVGD